MAAARLWRGGIRASGAREPNRLQPAVSRSAFRGSADPTMDSQNGRGGGGRQRPDRTRALGDLARSPDAYPRAARDPRGARSRPVRRTVSRLLAALDTPAVSAGPDPTVRTLESPDPSGLECLLVGSAPGHLGVVGSPELYLGRPDIGNAVLQDSRHGVSTPQRSARPGGPT